MLMEGRSVYVFAATTVPRVLREALEDAHLTTDDVDWFLLHQANERILEAVADRIGVPKDKFIINMDENGNTSAASIPLALDFAVKSGSVKKGDVLSVARLAGIMGAKQTAVSKLCTLAQHINCTYINL